jgi:predicted Zn-dependent protease
LRRVRFVDLEKAGQRHRRLGRVGAARGQRPRDKRRHPVADHSFDLARRQCPASAFAQHLVECGAQIEHGVDERAVEIEDEKKAFHKRNFVLSLHILQQTVCCNFAGAA